MDREVDRLESGLGNMSIGDNEIYTPELGELREMKYKPPYKGKYDRTRGSKTRSEIASDKQQGKLKRYVRKGVAMVPTAEPCNFTDDNYFTDDSVSGEYLYHEIPFENSSMKLTLPEGIPSLRNYVMMLLNKKSLDLCCEVKSLVFTPTMGRAKKGYFHTQSQEDMKFIHILVVREEQLSDYQATLGSTHVILTLPPQMKVGRVIVTPASGGIGYARLFIQRFANQLNQDYIFMLDDNISTLKERKGGIIEKVDLFRVLSHLEGQFYSDRRRQISGDPDDYASLGCFIFRPMKEPPPPFSRGNTCCLLLLNVRILRTKGIEFKPLRSGEDVTLFEMCNDVGLITCKYNWFIIHHVNFKSEIRTDLYYWTDAVHLLNHQFANPKHVTPEDSQEIIKPEVNRSGQVIKHNIDYSDKTWTAEMRDKRNGKYSLIIFLKGYPGDFYNDIKQVDKTYEEHFIIFDIAFCKEFGLVDRQSFGREVVEKMYEPDSIWEVMTTHNIDLYANHYVMLRIHGEVIPNT